MLLIACFSFQPPKKKNENAFAIRAAALAARRSGARLAPVSPPAALPTILTRNTREKQKNPKNRASSPEDPAQTLPLTASYSAGDMHASSSSAWRAATRRAPAPPAPAPPGAGAGAGARWGTREWPAGWPAGARGGTSGSGSETAYDAGAFSGSGAALLQKGSLLRRAFFPAFFFAPPRGRRRRRRGEGRAPFLFLFLIGRLRKLRLYLPRLRRIRGEVVHRNRGAPPRPARRRRRRNDAPLESRSRRGRKKNAAARRASSCRARRSRGFVVCASFLPFPDRLRLSLQNLGLQNEVDRRERVRGEVAAARARRRCSPFFFRGFRCSGTYRRRAFDAPLGLGHERLHLHEALERVFHARARLPARWRSPRSPCRRRGMHDGARLQSSRDVLG